MSYLARLKSGKGATDPTDKTDKTPSVSSVSNSSDHVSEIVRLLDRAGCGPDHPHHAQGLALALVFPGALETLRMTCPPRVSE